MNTIQKIGLGLGSVALGIGAAVGITYAADSVTNGTPTGGATTGGTSSGDTSTQAAAPSDGSAAQVPAGGPADPGGLPPGDDDHEDADHGRGGPGDLAAGLASSLGLDQATVQTALDEAFAQIAPSTDDDGRPDRAAMESQLAAALADSLGVDEATVTAALQSLHPDHDD